MEKQNLKEDWYKAKNLNGRDSQLLVELSTTNIESISKAIAALEALKKNLNIYKECLTDSINLEAESADLASKYAQDNTYQNNFNLPGTVSLPQSYDIDSIKKDSQRMIDIQKDRNKIASQSDTYLNICKAQMKVFVENWKNLNYGAVSWKEFILSLNQNINQNY
jgi:hypothetical protein